MFRYFEAAEIEFLRTLNITYNMDRSITFPRVHVECDYKLPLVSDDEIEIEVRIGRMGNTSVRFDFQTTKNGNVAARGHVAVVCMDRKTQRLADSRRNTAKARGGDDRRAVMPLLAHFRGGRFAPGSHCPDDPSHHYYGGDRDDNVTMNPFEGGFPMFAQKVTHSHERRNP